MINQTQSIGTVSAQNDGQREFDKQLTSQDYIFDPVFCTIQVEESWVGKLRKVEESSQESSQY